MNFTALAVIVAGVILAGALARILFPDRVDALIARFRKKPAAGVEPRPDRLIDNTRPDAAPVVTPANRGIDYAAYNVKPDGTEWTPQSLSMLGGPFTGGMPVGWDWKEWARVNGRPDPTARPDTGGSAPRRSGFDLVMGADPVVNDLKRSLHYQYRFTASGKVELAWSAKGGGDFIETFITGSDGFAVPDSEGQLRKRIIQGPAGQTYFEGRGEYVYHVIPGQDVTLGVQLAEAK